MTMIALTQDVVAFQRRHGMWVQRLSALVQKSSQHVLVAASREYGGQTVVSAFRAHKVPTLRMSVRGSEDPSYVMYGNALSDAVEDALGIRLFGYGLPFRYAMAMLLGQCDLFGRLCLTVVAESSLPREVLKELMSLSPERIWVVVSTDASQAEPSTGEVVVIDERQLRLTLEEAVSLAGESLSREDVENAWRAKDGAYLSVLTQVRDAALPPPVGAISQADRIPYGAAKQLLGAVMSQGRWLEALEIALAHCGDDVVDVFRRGASSFIEHGVCMRVWQLIESMPATEFVADDELVYWYFSVAMAANKHHSVAEVAQNYLEAHDAPDLRARWAVAFPSSTSLKNACKAYRDLENVNTARALGFVLTLENRSDEAIQILRVALEYAEALGASHQVAATALDMSHALTFEAKYRSAMNWAKWGLAQYSEAGVGDELLRLGLLNQAAYMALVVGETDAPAELLSSVTLPDDLVGVPMTEAVISTKGDLAFVQGDYGTAEMHYRRSYPLFPIAAAGFAALDLVRVLAVQERIREAREVVEQVKSVVPEGSGANHATLAICRGHVAYCEGAYQEAIEEYARVIHGHGARQSPFLITQAVFGAALSYEAHGEVQRARDILLRYKEYWQDVGESGLRILTIDWNSASRHWAASRGEASGLRLRFLGKRVAIAGNDVRWLSLRHAELAGLLALRVEGYRAEELLLELYGDEGRLGSLKALISRARKVVPIQSQPYRLGPGITSDLTDLESHLQAGRLHEALELYRGPLLPESQAPGIERARERIDETIRQAALHASEGELVLRAARKFPEDLELWERAAELIPKNDPTYPMVRARVRRIAGDWGL